MFLDAFGYGGYGPYQTLDGGAQQTIFGEGGVLGTVLNEELPPIIAGGGVQQPSWWQVLIPTVGTTLRDIYGSRAAVADYSNRQQYAAPQNYSVAPPGYSYNSSGQLVKDSVSNITDFVSNNPLLVGGAVLFVVVLFIKPPGRR